MPTQLLPFIANYLGKPNSGTNAANRGQCVGLVELWITELGKPFIPGNAKDLLNNADLRSYRLVRNLPTNFPPTGAIICWDATWGQGYGHTAIVVVATPMRFAVFEQNDPGGASPTVSTHDYRGVAGWLVPITA